VIAFLHLAGTTAHGWALPLHERSEALPKETESNVLYANTFD
ncbi:unnamed protein product, partial [marine sediment metagenome]